MTWLKTKNLMSVDPADPLAEQNVLNTNMVGTIWGSGVPASSKEDGVFQRIALDTARRMIRRNGQSGFLTRPTYLFSAGYPANSFHMPKSDAYIDGLSMTIAGVDLNSESDNLFQLTPPPISSTRFDLVFLECWLAEVPGSTVSQPVATNKPDATHVYKWGNVNHGGTNAVDDINEVNFEIRRRMQIQYRVRTFPNANFGVYPNGINDPANAAQGPNASVTALPFVVSSTDSSLYIAGAGTAAHQSLLGTLDGYVYAIPLAKVLRTTGVSLVSVNDVTDLRVLWGGSAGVTALLAGDNQFTGRQQFAKGADLAPAGSTITIGNDGNLFTVNGNGPFTGISSLQGGTEVDLYFPNPTNLIHNDTTFILPYRRIYRTVANEIVTFLSIGGGGWVVKGRSGPNACVGTSIQFNGSTPPDGFVLEYKQALSCTAFEGLLTEYLASGFVSAAAGVPGAPAWSAFTANASTDEIGITAHGRLVGDVVFFANVGGGMPGNLSAYTKYYVQAVTGVNTFKISTSRSGAAVDITTAGSGTLTAYNTFYAGDMNGRVARAADNLGGPASNRITNAAGAILGGGAGAEKHTNLVTEMAPHTHGSVRVPGGNASLLGGVDNIDQTGSTGSTGGGVAWDITSPYQTKSFCVRT